MAVKKGDTVQVDYIGTLDDGTVFDNSSEHGAPLQFKVGAEEVIKAFEENIVGMEQGQEKKFTLPAAKAYGDYSKDLVKEVPKTQLPPNIEPKVGMTMVMNLSNGMQIPTKIEKVSDTTITIDLNHPLAGKNLTFKVKVVAITA